MQQNPTNESEWQSRMRVPPPPKVGLDGDRCYFATRELALRRFREAGRSLGSYYHICSCTQ